MKNLQFPFTLLQKHETMYDISFVSSHGALSEQQLEMVILATNFPVIKENFSL